MIAIAAIAAAGLAAYVASRNHRQQLEHDRAMRNRDSTRNVIDEAVEGIADTVLLTADFSARVGGVERARSLAAKLAAEGRDLAAAKKETEQIAEEANEIMKPTFASARRMITQTARLAIRLGDGHPITTHHGATRKALDKWQDAAVAGLAQNRTAAQKKEENRIQTELGNARAQFAAACRSWLTT